MSICSEMSELKKLSKAQVGRRETPREIEMKKLFDALRPRYDWRTGKSLEGEEGDRGRV